MAPFAPIDYNENANHLAARTCPGAWLCGNYSPSVSHTVYKIDHPYLFLVFINVIVSFFCRLRYKQ